MEGLREVQPSGYAERWREHNESRRTIMLAAAVDLSEMPGTSATIQNIAGRTGFAKSVVYRQFKDQNDLDLSLRRHVLDTFTDDVTSRIDVSHGSVTDVLRRTILFVAEWMSAHPLLVDLLRSGPPAGGDGDQDAVTHVKRQIVDYSQATLRMICIALNVAEETFQYIPYVVVSMVEASLVDWARGASPVPADEPELIVDELTRAAWLVLNGAARSVGVSIDPDEELTTAVTRLSGEQ